MPSLDLRAVLTLHTQTCLAFNEALARSMQLARCVAKRDVAAGDAEAADVLPQIEEDLAFYERECVRLEAFLRDNIASPAGKPRARLRIVPKGD